MPLLFLVAGVLLIVVGINNRLPDLVQLAKDDFAPSGNVASFQIWALAIVMVGALGYVRELKPVANALLVLIVIALLLSHKGFIGQFDTALKGKSNG